MNWLVSKQVAGVLGVHDASVRTTLGPLRPSRKRQVGMTGKGHAWPADVVEEVMDLAKGAGVPLKHAARVVAYQRANGSEFLPSPSVERPHLKRVGSD